MKVWTVFWFCEETGEKSCNAFESELDAHRSACDVVLSYVKTNDGCLDVYADESGSDALAKYKLPHAGDVTLSDAKAMLEDFAERIRDNVWIDVQENELRKECP